MRLLMLLMAALTMSACGEKMEVNVANAASIQQAKNQSKNQPQASEQAQVFEITIDGEKLVMDVDQPSTDQLVTAGIVDNKILSLSAIHKPKDFSLGILFHADQIKPGTYSVYTCIDNEGCQSDYQTSASLNQFPGKPFVPSEIKTAYLVPRLNLQGMTVVLTAVDDVFWNGVGPSKRIKGHFSGQLAYVEGQYQQAKIVGPLKKVEGKFDLYTVLR